MLIKHTYDPGCVAALRAATQQTVLNALSKRYKHIRILLHLSHFISQIIWERYSCAQHNHCYGGCRAPLIPFVRIPLKIEEKIS
jgi:hypothetical protein